MQKKTVNILHFITLNVALDASLLSKKKKKIGQPVKFPGM